MKRSDKYFPVIGLILVFLATGMIIRWIQPPPQPSRVYNIIAPTPAKNETNGGGIDYAKINGSPSGTAIGVYQEFQRADRRLNVIYRRILRDYQKNRFFLVKLREAERAWLKYRDAHLGALYPQYKEEYQCNSDYAIAYYLEKAHLTWERVNQLDEWLKNYREDERASAGGLGSRGQKGTPGS